MSAEIRVDESEFLRALERRTTITDLARLNHIADAVLDAFGELLTPEEAAQIRRYLPESKAALLLNAAKRPSPDGGEPELLRSVAWRESAPASEALRHLRAVCEVIGGLLPDDVRNRIAAHLPSDVAYHLKGECHSDPSASTSPAPACRRVGPRSRWSLRRRASSAP